MINFSVHRKISVGKRKIHEGEIVKREMEFKSVPVC